MEQEIFGDKMKTNFAEWIKGKLLKEMSDIEAEQILGVKRGDPNIRKAWVKLASLHHPDRGGDVEMMKKINAARDVLEKPPVHRAQSPQSPQRPQSPQNPKAGTGRDPKAGREVIYALQEEVMQLAESMDEETVFNIYCRICNEVAAKFKGYERCNTPETFSRNRGYGKRNMGINIYTYWVVLHGPDEESYIQLLEFMKSQNVK